VYNNLVSMSSSADGCRDYNGCIGLTVLLWTVVACWLFQSKCVACIHKHVSVRLPWVTSCFSVSVLLGSFQLGPSTKCSNIQEPLWRWPMTTFWPWT